MNRLPATSPAARLNALAAAALVTLALLSGIDHLALVKAAATQLAQGTAASAA